MALNRKQNIGDVVRVQVEQAKLKETMKKKLKPTKIKAKIQTEGDRKN